MPFENTIDLLENIMRHVVECQNFKELICIKDVSSMKDYIGCNCGKKWEFDEMEMTVESETGYELLHFITQNQFSKDNSHIKTIINIYKNLDKKEISEQISNNINNKKRSLFDNLEI